MTARLSVAVMAHRKRADFVPDLLGRLGVGGDRVVWDRRNDRWDTGRRAMAHHDPDATHHLVVQDDAVVCDDLIAGVERALGHIPTSRPAPMCLYVGRLTPYRTQVQRLVNGAADASWLTMAGLHWGVGIVMPVELIEPMVAWGDRNGQIANYDKRISRWLAGRGIRTWYPWPSLVDHRDSPSLVPRRRSRGRVAHRFLGVDRSALGVDWSGRVIHVPELRRHNPRPVAPKPTAPRKEKPMPPIRSDEIMIAARSAVVSVDGQRCRIRRLATIAHRDSRIVQVKPHLWEPLRIHYPAEETTEPESGEPESGEPSDDPLDRPNAASTRAHVDGYARQVGIDPAGMRNKGEVLAAIDSHHSE